MYGELVRAFLKLPDLTAKSQPDRQTDIQTDQGRTTTVFDILEK